MSGVSNRWSRHAWWLRTLIVFAVSRALVVAVGVMGNSVFLPANEGVPKNRGVLSLFFGWDSAFYLRIVDHGYRMERGEMSTAFFPLFPLCVKGVSLLGVPVIPAGFFVSNVATLVAALLFERIVRAKWGEKAAERAVLLLLFSPASLHFSMFYSEGAFLAASVACAYFIGRRQWLWAGVAGALTSAGRSNGVFISVVAFWEAYAYFRSTPAGKRDYRALWVLLTPLGLATYMIYLKLHFDNPFGFVQAGGEWDRHLTWFWHSFDPHREDPIFYRAVFVGTPVFVLLSAALMRKVRVPSSYIAYTLISLAYMISTGRLEGIVRYTGVLFPIYVVWAALSLTCELAFSLVLATFVAVLALCDVLVVNGYWWT